MPEVIQFQNQTEAARFFAGATSVDILSETYRPRDQAAFDRCLSLVERGRLSWALEEHQQSLREAMVTGDLPVILSGSVDLHVRQGYESITQNWRECFRAVPYANFREQTLINFGDLEVDDEAGGLIESGRIPMVPERHGYNDARVSEYVEYAQLLTYGCTFMITRQMMVNDDKRSLAALPRIMGVAMTRTLNWHVAQALEGNPAMSDGNNLFDAANHNNFVAAGTALTHANLVAQIGAFGNQTSPMGRVLHLDPKFLIVPQELEMQANYLVSQAATRLIATDHAAAASTVAPDYNILAGRLQVVMLEELTDANDWYLAADPNEFDTIEVGFLDGRETPELFSQTSHDVDLHASDGMTYKIRHDWDAYPAAWRGLRRITGA